MHPGRHVLAVAAHVHVRTLVLASPLSMSTPRSTKSAAGRARAHKHIQCSMRGSHHATQRPRRNDCISIDPQHLTSFSSAHTRLLFSGSMILCCTNTLCNEQQERSVSASHLAANLNRANTCERPSPQSYAASEGLPPRLLEGKRHLQLQRALTLRRDNRRASLVRRVIGQSESSQGETKQLGLRQQKADRLQSRKPQSSNECRITEETVAERAAESRRRPGRKKHHSRLSTRTTSAVVESR